jgi:ribonuclease Z
VEPFKIHILGCGSALPTLKHFASSQVVEIREKLFMIDCGEGTQMQLRRSRIRFTKISAVFISHLHGDHCFGLIGMISTFGMLGRTAPLHIYAPGEFKQMLDSMMDMFCFGLGYDIEFHPVDTKENKVIYEDRSLTVTTLPLKHRLPCCGFLFKEKPTLPHIREI